MGAVFDAWREHLDGKRHKGLLKHSTLLSYHAILKKYLRPAFGAIRSDRLTSQVVISWESRLAETLAPKTLNNVVTTMRGLLSWAREQQFLAHDPMATIKPARVPKEEQPCLQPDELNNLLDAAATLPTRDQAIVYLAAYSGLRRGELFGLQWGDLDESKHQIPRPAVVVSRGDRGTENRQLTTGDGSPGPHRGAIGGLSRAGPPDRWGCVYVPQ